MSKIQTTCRQLSDIFGQQPATRWAWIYEEQPGRRNGACAAIVIVQGKPWIAVHLNVARAFVLTFVNGGLTVPCAFITLRFANYKHKKAVFVKTNEACTVFEQKCNPGRRLSYVAVVSLWLNAAVHCLITPTPTKFYIHAPSISVHHPPASLGASLGWGALDWIAW